MPAHGAVGVLAALALLATCGRSSPTAPPPPPPGGDHLSVPSGDVVTVGVSGNIVSPGRTAVGVTSATDAGPDMAAGTEVEAAVPPCSRVPGVCCVAIQPLGPVPAEELQAVADALASLYGFQTRILEEVPLPREAWYEPRRRYRAERLLEFLAPRLPEGCDRIAGVTTRDISTTKGRFEDWGILGLAEQPGVASVMSTFRCRRRVRAVPPIERLRRLAIHEVGHTLGLPHCPTYGCFMEDAHGKVETIDHATFLCDVCRKRLGWLE